MAVFTLPPDMIRFYKKNIEYITEHAVDPDKRRYATKHEGVRHYIDIDHWGDNPFETVPKKWADALMRYSRITYHDINGETIDLVDPDLATYYLDSIYGNGVNFAMEEYSSWFRSNVIFNYYDGEWELPVEIANEFINPPLDTSGRIVVKDEFSEYGILPYHLVKMQNNLKNAFLALDARAILRISAEIGHYIADAHVPLHTTENYNGQMTNQDGIHAFWESRIPELFADETYDYFVGKSEYIYDISEHYWAIVQKSNSLLDSVLVIEKRLSEQFPSDQQFCYDARLESTLRIQCPEYAKAYEVAMAGMVEDRMRGSIQAVGSAWYTAWLDAGQPDLKTILDQDTWNDLDAQRQKEEEEMFKKGEIKGREHSQ